MKKIISTIAVMSAFAIIIVFCLISVLTQKNTEYREKADFKQIEEIVTEEETHAIKTPIILYTDDEETVIELSNQSSETITYYQPHSVDDLLSINSDCFGWISIAGTNISYPVMHTPDNTQKYLNKNFYGEYSQSGVPFLDSRCKLDSTNLIMYGHNMNSGTMFADLCNYTDYSYFTQHPTVILEAKEKIKTYTVFAVMEVKSDDSWYRFITADTKRDYDCKIKYAKEHSLYDTGITPKYNKQILTLSTCYGGNSDNRILVLASDYNTQAEVIYLFSLSDKSEEKDFVKNFVSCFKKNQSDEDLIKAVNSKFGIDIKYEEFKNVMQTINSTKISTSGYTEKTTKNNLDLVKWCKNAEQNGWGYVYGGYGQISETFIKK